MGTSNFRSTFLQNKYPQIPSERFQSQYWQHLAPSQVSCGFFSRKIKYGHYQTYQHYITREEIDKYPLLFPNKEQFQIYIESFIWRMRQDYLVNAVYLEENAGQFCTYQRKANIFIPHIPLRLENVNDIPYPFDINLLKSAMLGFQKLYDHVGYFKIREGQICIDSQGLVKVWINNDLSKNYPDNGNFVNIQGTMSQSEMVKQILEVVLSNLEESSQPESLSQFIYSKLTEKPNNSNKRFNFQRVISFQEVLNLIQEYVQKHNTQVPENFRVIVQLMQRGSYQRVIKRQSISENVNLKSYNASRENKMGPNPSKQITQKILNKSKNSITKDGNFKQSQKKGYSKESSQSLNHKTFTLKGNKSSKSSLKDILCMNFNSKSFLPKFCDQPSNVAQSGGLIGKPINSEFQVPKLLFKQEKNHKKTLFPNISSRDHATAQGNQTIFDILSDSKLRKRTVCQTQRKSSQNAISCPSSGNSIPITVTTKQLNRMVNVRPLMPNPNYTTYPQSIYNPMNLRNIAAHSSGSNRSYQNYKNVQTPLYYQHNTMMPQIVQAIPAQMQLILSNPSYKGQGKINRTVNHHLNKIQEKSVKTPMGNIQQVPSQVVEASEEKESSNINNSNVDVQFSYAMQMDNDNHNGNNDSLSMQKRQDADEIIEGKIQKTLQSNLDNPDQKSLICQKMLKNQSSDQKTVNLSDKESRFSHSVSKEDHLKINRKESKNKIFYSKLLSQNDSDHIEESSISIQNEKSNKDSLLMKDSKKQKTQKQIRQSARKQFMAQVNKISQAYKKSFASQQNKKGLQHMMESLLSNYYTNQAFLVPQTHYSQTSRIPKKVPGLFLLQNQTIKQVSSALNLDPEVMRDLKVYESMESL